MPVRRILLPYNRQPPSTAPLRHDIGLARGLLAASAVNYHGAWLRDVGVVQAQQPASAPTFTNCVFGKATQFTTGTTAPVTYTGLKPYSFPITVVVQFRPEGTTGLRSMVAQGGENSTSDGWKVWRSAGNLGVTLGGVANYTASGHGIAAGTEYIAAFVIPASGAATVYSFRPDTKAFVVSNTGTLGTLVPAIDTAPLSVGAGYTGAGYNNGFQGAIGSFAVWDRTLTETEVRALFGNFYQLWGMPQSQFTAAVSEPVEVTVSGFEVTCSIGSTTQSGSAGWSTYTRTADTYLRTFNFNGESPFVNPATGQPDLRNWLFTDDEDNPVTNAGEPPWIIKTVEDGSWATRFQLLTTDANLYGPRTQADSYQYEPYKQYTYEIEFKLDSTWDLTEGMPGEGLMWQSKGLPKAGQFSNASMSLNLLDDALWFSILYPYDAYYSSTWPDSFTWTNTTGAGGYLSTSFSTQTIAKDTTYNVRIEFFADDRPPQHGGQGYCRVYLDDVLWIDHEGPNQHPDQNGDHRWDHGWYQWGETVATDRTIYHFKNHARVADGIAADDFEITGSVGDVSVPSVNLTLTGFEVTGSVGDVTVTADASVTIEGFEATGALGDVTITADAGVDVEGFEAASALGDVTITADAGVAVEGFEIASALGDVTITADAGVAVEGFEIASALGDVTLDTASAIALEGFEITSALGAVTVTADASVDVEGFETASALGDVTVSAAAGVTLEGFESTCALGTPSVEAGGSVDITVVGFSVTTAVGDPTTSADASLSVSGVSSACSVGAVTLDIAALEVAVDGLEATAGIGAVSVPGTGKTVLLDNHDFPCRTRLGTVVATRNEFGIIGGLTSSGGYTSDQASLGSGWSSTPLL